MTGALKRGRMFRQRHTGPWGEGHVKTEQSCKGHHRKWIQQKKMRLKIILALCELIRYQFQGDEKLREHIVISNLTSRKLTETVKNKILHRR